jgi:HemY protein
VRLGTWAIAALFLGALGAHFLLQDKGYVLIDFRSYVIEMSVPVLFMVLLGAYLLIRLSLQLWHAPRRLGAAVAERRHRRASEKLTRGLIDLTEGRFGRSEKTLTRHLGASDAPLLNYLMAARAAHSQGATDRRNEWLKLAYERLPEAETTVLLTQAQMQYEAQEYEQALASLQRIQEAHPEHPVALSLLARTYAALDDWSRVVDLLPQLGRARLPDAALESLASDALEHAFTVPELTSERIDAIWTPLPAALKGSPRLKRLHAVALNRLGRGRDAERELRSALKQRWDPELVRAYGEVAGEDPAKQLRNAERWLRQYPEDAALLVTAARLSIANELWGKARSYLESSLAIAPDADAYALYGRLLNRLGQSDDAASAFRSGLGLISPDVGAPLALDAPRRASEGD